MIFRSVSFRLFALVGVLGLAMAIAPVDDAMASYYHPWVDKSHVDSNVVVNGGNWTYTFTLFNDSYEGTGSTSAPMPVIVSWDLPWFGDANITNIQSPVGWDYTIEKIGTGSPVGWDGTAAWQNPSDPLYQGPTSPFTTVTTVLHWYTDPSGATDDTSLANAVFPAVGYTGAGQSSLTGFIFTASYGSTGAPYQSSWVGLWHYTGDPNLPLLAVPGSPDILGSTPVGGTPVPEASTLLLLGSGLIGLAGYGRKRFFKK